MELDTKWRENRTSIELSPDSIAHALNSIAEDMIFLTSRVHSQEVRDQSICVLLSAEGKEEETLLYFRKESSYETIVIQMRNKTKPKEHISTTVVSPITKAESVIAPNTLKGVILSLADKGEVMILENGFVDTRIVL